MTAAHTTQEAAARLRSFLDEGRLVQGDWRRIDGGGRELACLLGAIDPSISSAEHCAAEAA